MIRSIGFALFAASVGVLGVGCSADPGAASSNPTPGAAEPGASTTASSTEARAAVPTGRGYVTRERAAFLASQTVSGVVDGETGPSNAAKPGGGGKTNGISYHGGPIMTGTKTIYYIWYGNWGSNTAGTILTNLAQNLGGSPYYNINSTYTNGAGGTVDNLVAYGGSTTDNYSQGTSLSDAQIASVVSSAITSGRLPSNSNAVYFVLTSSDVTASSGFCTQYCGWHDHTTIGGQDIKYSFVGNPDRCPSACEAQTTSPNGNAGADGMASIIAHEFEEASTDPDLSAWYDARGQENADKCAWTFGTESTASNGSKYNVTFGGKQYLIQQNWLNASGGKCTMSY